MDSVPTVFHPCLGPAIRAKYQTEFLRTDGRAEARMGGGDKYGEGQVFLVRVRQWGGGKTHEASLAGAVGFSAECRKIRIETAKASVSVIA